MRRYLALAVTGAVLIAAGVALWSIPAGLVSLGVQAIVGAFCGLYVRAKKLSTEVRR